MNYIALTRWPEGRTRCLTFSYDDGRPQDRRLAGMFDTYGLKGTFHLNSSGIGKENYITPEEMPELYKKHEISAHCVHHPFMDNQPDLQIIREVEEDRAALERIAGYMVRGMSYPYGLQDDRIVRVLKSTGVNYSRTTRGTMSFAVPEEFLRWHPTCHDRNITPELTERFLNPDRGMLRRGLILYYVWGHSFEFDSEEKWQRMEAFCKQVSGNDDVWYATNIEIYDYVTALHRLEFGAHSDMVYNPSAVPVWITVNQEVLKVDAGETVQLGSEPDTTLKP